MGARVSTSFQNPSWMPFSVGEAARAGDATADDLVSGRALSHLFDALRRSAERVVADGMPENTVDVASGFRHLLVLLGLGLDAGLRADPDAVVALKVSGVDNVYKWGMDCSDCIYTGASYGRASPTGSGVTGARRATSASNQWPAWPPRPTCSSTSSISVPAGRWTWSSRRGSTRGTGSPWPRTPQTW